MKTEGFRSREGRALDIAAFLVAVVTAFFVSNVRPIVAYLLPNPDLRPFSLGNLVLNLPFLFLLVAYFVGVQRIATRHKSRSATILNITLIVASIAVCIFALSRVRLQ
jgi:hypothetical protein